MTNDPLAKRGKNAEGGDPIRLPILIRLFAYVLKKPLPMIAAFAIMLASNLLALAAPKLSGKAIDLIEENAGGNLAKILSVCGVMALLYAASTVLSWLLSVVMLRISRSVSRRMRNDLFDRLLSLPVSYFDTHQVGELISRFSYDVDTINASLANDMLQICGSAITVVGSFVMMMTIKPVLVLVFAVTIPVSVAFTRYKSRKVRPLFRKRSEKLGLLNGYSEEMLSGQKSIRAYHREEKVVSRFDEYNEDAVTAYYRADYHSCVIGPSVNFINNLSLSLISMFGALLYLRHAIRLGDISTFILYSRKFAGPINEAANIIAEIQSACSATERVFAVLDEKPERIGDADAVELDAVRGDVEAKDVVFSYEEGRTVLDHVSFLAPAGKTTAIVGPTGAGKTTIINLLMRFYEHNEGSITLDGIPIGKISLPSLRRAFSMVLQETWLFSGTVMENIRYGREGATDEEVIEAAKAAHIHEYVMSLPDGYQTVITEGGTNLSKGQKQLLTIARAMICKAPILILDEATSNVDSRTEKQIQQAMLQLMQGKTCFVIAHRLSTIENADNILVVRDHRIEEQGTHEQLLRRGGFYALLYGSQFRNETM